MKIHIQAQIWIGKAWKLANLPLGVLWAIAKRHWELRNVDPEICCCGSMIGTGGSICHHGGCRSAKEYALCDLPEQLLKERARKKALA